MLDVLLHLGKQLGLGFLDGHVGDLQELGFLLGDHGGYLLILGGQAVLALGQGLLGSFQGLLFAGKILDLLVQQVAALGEAFFLFPQLGAGGLGFMVKLLAPADEFSLGLGLGLRLYAFGLGFGGIQSDLGFLLHNGFSDSGQEQVNGQDDRHPRRQADGGPDQRAGETDFCQ